jgi:hypothetical protein
VEEHAFADSELCESFSNWMLFGWVSSQNCAQIYNATSAQSTTYSCQDLSLSSGQVWRAFALNALILDAEACGTTLILPASGEHDKRLQHAMEIRNRRMMIDGQPERMHACKICERFISGPQDGFKGLRESCTF